jgi:hypothetical protein
MGEAACPRARALTAASPSLPFLPPWWRRNGKCTSRLDLMAGSSNQSISNAWTVCFEVSSRKTRETLACSKPASGNGVGGSRNVRLRLRSSPSTPRRVINLQPHIRRNRLPACRRLIHCEMESCMGVSMYICFTIQSHAATCSEDLRISGACNGRRHLLCRAGVPHDAWLMTFLVDSAMHLYAS